MIEYIMILAFLLVIMIFLYRRAQKELKDLKFSKQSLSSKYGKMTEQFMPLLKDYPYDPQNFRFLGSPVDGVQFSDDEITFVEFKSSNSVLSKKQKAIRELIEKGKVRFKEMRLG